MSSPAVQIETPRTLAEALLCLDTPGSPPLLVAGACQVMGAAAGDHTRLIDLSRVVELRGVREQRDGLTIGALTTMRELVESVGLELRWPLLVAAARASGAAQILNRATLGGCLATRTLAVEVPVALLVHEAEIEINGRAGARRIPMETFVSSAAVDVRLQPGELITAVHLPQSGDDDHVFFRKVAGRRAAAPAKVVVAGRAVLRQGGVVQEIAIGLGAVAPRPLRARRAEESLVGRVLTLAGVEAARAAIMADVHPADDVHTTARYRRLVTGNLIARWLGELSVSDPIGMGD